MDVELQVARVGTGLRKHRAKRNSQRVGHADISMTLNRYIHITPDIQRAAADTLVALFSKVS
jgi:hypothetical protein